MTNSEAITLPLPLPIVDTKAYTHKSVFKQKPTIIQNSVYETEKSMSRIAEPQYHVISTQLV